MKLLFISQNFPYPPYHDGTRLKVYNLIKYLSKYNEMFLITFCASEEQKYINEISKFCSKIITVPLKEGNGKFSLAKKLVRNALDPRRFESPEMHLEISKAIREWGPDIVHVDLPMMSPYSRTIGSIPKVIASHDAISLFAYKNWKISSSLLHKAMWYWLYKQRKWVEARYYPSYDACTVVSNEDKVFLKGHCPALRTEVVPNGVDVEYFDADALDGSGRPANPGIGIFGGMDFIPNIDAVMYFASEIYPLVKNAVAGLRFFIVGRNPDIKIKSLANNENIFVTGEVEDIREYYQKVSIVAAPVRLGSGIKNTVLQAMSMSKPIVATPQAVRAIDIQDGVHLLTAESAEEFSRKVITLLRDDKLRETLGKNARDLIAQKYSWESHAKRFQKLYEDIVHN